MRITLARKAMRWVMYGLVGVGLAYVLSTVSGPQLRAALQRVPAWCVAAGAACAFINLFGKGTIWWLLLPPTARPPLLSLWAIVLRAAASSIVMPFRAGEGLRVWWLMNRCQLPMAHVLAVALAEKVANLTGLLLIVALAGSIERVTLPWVTRAGTWLLVIVAGACLLGGLALALRRHLGRVGASLREVSQGGPWPFALALLCALLGWTGDCALVWLMAQGVGAPLRPLCTPFVLLAINVAIALPGTPGHVGTMELASITALSAFGAGRETALSFALLYHGVQVVAVLMLTGLHLGWVQLRGGAIDNRATTARPPGTLPDK